MTFGRSSRSFRPTRGGRGSFRGRGSGRGNSDYYGSSRGSFSGRSTSRGSYRGSSFRGRESSYESRESSRSNSDRYPSSHSRRDDSYHHREIRESASGSFGRDYRRSEGEPERKRIKSEIGSSYKEGFSPRRSYDDMEHSSRSFNSNNSSPYRSESSPFGKMRRSSKEFSDFKKPMPPSDSSFNRRSSRGSRGRGSTRTSIRIIKSSAPPFLKRSGVGRISKIKTTSRLQQILKKRKQLRLTRMRKAREVHDRSTEKGKNVEQDSPISDEEFKTLDMQDDGDNEDSKEGVIVSEDEQKITKTFKKVKSSVSESSEKSNAQGESSKFKSETRSPIKGLHKDHITLKCVHCKIESPTFKRYAYHLTSFNHKTSMEALLHELKQKLRRMRTEQRVQQRIIDEQSNDFAKTSYCRVCKLNYKQSKQEHFTSDFHINLNEFLNPRCTVCRISFSTPILYEHHRCTLNHIKRKAFLERKGINVKEADAEEENNDEDNFMVLDSVGSADESDETMQLDNAIEDESGLTPESDEKKKKTPKIVGSEFIKRVSVYYCKLCRLCLTYNPNRDQEDSLLSHCRGRFHLKRYSLEKARKVKENNSTLEMKNNDSKTTENDKIDANDSVELDEDGKFWNDDSIEEEQKFSEDEDDTKENNRYDRFSHSEENESSEKSKNAENIANEEDGSTEVITLE